MARTLNTSPSRIAASFASTLALVGFVRAQTSLIEIAELLPTNDALNRRAGEAVAIDGNRIVIGARSDGLAGSSAGAVYVFVGNGGIWGEEATLTAGASSGGDLFGTDVDIQGDTVIVGAPGDDEAGLDAGAVYIFGRTGTGWVEQGKLLASDASDTSRFGQAVAIDGDWLIVGASSDDFSATSAGAAYVFERTGTVWGEHAILRPAISGSQDRFGADVDISGSLVVIGATGVSVSGGVYLSGRVGTAWIEGPFLNGAAANSTHTVGNVVALSGLRLAVGVPDLDINGGTDQGGVYVYERSGTSWSKTATLASQDQGVISNNANFGSAIHLDGDFLTVGEPKRNRIYRYEQQGAQWVPRIATPADFNSNDLGGTAVAATSTTLVMGSPHHDHAASNSGAVYVLSLEPDPLPDFCFGDGGDLMGCFPCPCGNDGPVGSRRGCTNSTGLNCLLKAQGIPSASLDTLRFDAEGVNILTFALLLSADNRLPQMGPCPVGSGINAPAAPLDGLRCIGGNLLRHGTRATDFNGDIVAPWGPPGAPAVGLIAQGGFVAGQTRQFQVFYRELDTLGCGTGLNTSNGLTTTFIP